MPPPVVGGGFATTPEERTIIDVINRSRAAEKVAAVTPQQKLFEIARAAATAAVEKKPAPKAEIGYRNKFEFVVPAPAGLSPEAVLGELMKQKSLRNSFVDEELHDIGVGVATKDGATIYMILLAGGIK
jgi:hypothetical protein